MTSSDFFVFRTPLLPFDDLESWGRELSVPEADEVDATILDRAVTADRERLRRGLQDLLRRPEVLEALFVASPSMVDALEYWRRRPDGKRGLRVEHTLVRYVLRMTARATPFGLFSGNSMSAGEPWTNGAALHLAARDSYRRHTRLDTDYLFSLAESLGRRPEVWKTLPLVPNTSLYRVAERLHYAEARLDGKLRSYHLVAVDPNPFLDAALSATDDGATASEVADALVDTDPDGDVTQEQALDFVGELIANQLLLVDLLPLVTGPGALPSLIADLEVGDGPGRFAKPLRTSMQRLTALDESGIGSPPDRYREIARELDSALPAEADVSRLFQVDMIKPVTEATLPKGVLNDLLDGIKLLHRLHPRPPEETSLDRFRSEFLGRYGDRQAVPLTEVLDEEVGIGFERAETPRATASPLLAGLPFAATEQGTAVWSRTDTYRLQRLQSLVAAGSHTWELSDRDVEAMGSDAAKPLPEAYQLMAEIAASSEDEVRGGHYQLLLKGAMGPSGARLLGRFCHLDANLEERVRLHLKQEEELWPEAIFAEIVHLPQGRVGNILARPRLRQHEIEFLGRASAEPEHRIRLSDLRVSVIGERVVLTSERLGREIVPRLTTAHNFYNRGLGLYRFLCALQAQSVTEGIVWKWGPLSGAPFLPRVSRGRVVFSRARWLMHGREIEGLVDREGGELMAATRRWRRRRGIPRWCVFKEGDNELLMDLENVLVVESFRDSIKGRSTAALVEFFPGSDELWTQGPEGRFVHELVVPVVRSSERPVDRRPAALALHAAAEDTSSARAVFPPGSEWAYFKLYQGPSTADAVLRQVVAPLVRHAVAEGMIDSWFFLRFRDPERHLRLRFHGEPKILQRRLVPMLERNLSPWMEDGRVWRVQMDTYQREMFRYGGPDGIELLETVFHADSQAVLDIVGMLAGDAGADLRWRICLYGLDRLFDDLDLDLEGKLQVTSEMRENFAREFEATLELKRKIGDRHRQERRNLESLLESDSDDTPLTPALKVFDRRSLALSEIVPRLAARERDGRLTQSIERMAPSLAHMHVNRMIQSYPRAHELVLYEFLYRTYTAQAARLRAEKRKKARSGA